jgi:ParB-like nuclease domain
LEKKKMPFDHEQPGIAEIPIATIHIGDRFRRELGDIASLAASIADVGLLHPIVVAPDYHLIAGARRLRSSPRPSVSRIGLGSWSRRWTGPAASMAYTKAARRREGRDDPQGAAVAARARALQAHRRRSAVGI